MKYSNSQIDLYSNKCPLAWHYQRHIGLRKRGIGSINDHHLAFGKAWHKAMEVLYLSPDYSLRLASEAFIAAYPAQLDPSDHAKTEATGLEALAAYIARYRDEDSSMHVLCVETLEQDADDSDMVIDLVYEDLRYPGSVIIVDHKTVGGRNKYLSADYWEPWADASVVSRYIAQTRQKFGRCDGLVINAVSFGYRTKATKDKKTKKLLPIGSWQRFGRQAFNRDNAQIHLDRQSDLAWSAQMQISELFDMYPQRKSQCRWCTYREICTAGQEWPRSEENILASYYIVCDADIDGTRDRCVLETGHEGEHLKQHLPEPELVIVEDYDDELEGEVE